MYYSLEVTCTTLLTNMVELSMCDNTDSGNSCE